ncbi:MAG: hypothetical protein QM589_04460 [Thermomicrobiales bacterium]
MFSRRTLAQTAVGGAATFAMSGSATVRAQHAPRPPASPAPGTAIPASETTADGLRIVQVDGQPVALSPDGKWLAGPGPEGDVCLWDVETLEVCRATGAAPQTAQMPTITWAPDSSAVAYTLDVGRLLVDSDIYVMDVDGTMHDLTDDETEDAIGFDDVESPFPVDMFPAWSPDGTHLVFARTPWGLNVIPTTIVTMSREGGEPIERLTLAPPEPWTIYSPMHWLEDDSVLFSVMHADVGNPQNGVWWLGATGSISRVLA